MKTKRVPGRTIKTGDTIKPEQSNDAKPVCPVHEYFMNFDADESKWRCPEPACKIVKRADVEPEQQYKMHVGKGEVQVLTYQGQYFLRQGNVVISFGEEEAAKWVNMYSTNTGTGEDVITTQINFRRKTKLINITEPPEKFLDDKIPPV